MGSGEYGLETAISYLLIAGVVVSLLLLTAGLIVFHAVYGRLDVLLSDDSTYITGRNFFSFLLGLATGKWENPAILLITLGIVALFMTVYIRVIMSVLYFAWKRDAKYVLITAFVLVALTLSLMFH